MPEQPIEIAVEFDGADQAVRELGQVSQGVREVGTAAASSTTSFADFARSAQGTVQRIQGVAGAVQSLVSALGSRDRTAGLVASVAGATAQFAAMGSLLGPAGTVIGGVIGLTTSIAALASAHGEAADAAGREGDALSDLGSSADAARTALERLNDVRRRAAATEDEREARRTLGRFVRGDIREGEGAAAAEYLSGPRARRAESGLLSDEGALDAWNEMTDSALATAEAMRDTERAARDRGGRRGGGSASAASRDGQTLGFGGQGDIGLPGESRTQADAIEEADRLFDEAMEREIARQDRMAEKAREVSEYRIELAKEEGERINAEMERLGEEQEERRRLADERELEQRESVNGELMGLLGDTTMAFGKTLAHIATGEQTAEEAFKGLAKSFLEMISQYTTLKAATEFAEAGGAFARYDYGGGAAHIAAGVAFTAVAVATGVGAAAIGSAPAAPARPEAGGGENGTGRGGDTIINWNSPVITATTQAELGRELRTAIEAAGSI